MLIQSVSLQLFLWMLEYPDHVVPKLEQNNNFTFELTFIFCLLLLHGFNPTNENPSRSRVRSESIINSRKTVLFLNLFFRYDKLSLCFSSLDLIYIFIYTFYSVPHTFTRYMTIKTMITSFKILNTTLNKNRNH
jgi:hypothetical protein